MELEYGIFPDFYKKCDWFVEEEENDLFTEHNYLKNSWRSLLHFVSILFYERR